MLFVFYVLSRGSYRFELLHICHVTCTVTWRNLFGWHIRYLYLVIVHILCFLKWLPDTLYIKYGMSNVVINCHYAKGKPRYSVMFAIQCVAKKDFAFLGHENGQVFLSNSVLKVWIFWMFFFKLQECELMFVLYAILFPKIIKIEN